jgi:hypothetical protein
MARRVNKKCLKCSVLAVEEARQLHGVDGDGCWDDLKCHKRRSHYRHRSERNFKRGISRQLKENSDIAGTDPLTAVLSASSYFPLLILYTDHPPRRKEKVLLHAIGAELWLGTEQQAKIEPVHCFALSQEQVGTLTQQILKKFSEYCGTGEKFDVFSELIYRDMEHCPIRPCPLHS